MILKHGESSVELIREFWPRDVQTLLESIPLQQRQIKMFGKVYDEPRLTAWFGSSYSYSGITLAPSRIPEMMASLMSATANQASFEFNSVLTNCYQDGNDYMGWHRDNEREIDQRTIASVSFGAARRFKIRHRKSKETTNIELGNGDLLLMHNIQEDFEHCLPKSARVKDKRYNLTFRRILSACELC